MVTWPFLVVVAVILSKALKPVVNRLEGEVIVYSYQLFLTFQENHQLMTLDYSKLRSLSVWCQRADCLFGGYQDQYYLALTWMATVLKKILVGATWNVAESHETCLVTN